MRKDNYKVFIYDHCGRFIQHITVWAINSSIAIKKADEYLIGRKKDPMYYTCVAREIGR